MKLVRKVKVNYLEAICSGCITSLEENKPLASMLANIEEQGIKEYLSDEKLKGFAVGLLYSFENDGLIKSKKLTSLGEEVIRSKKAWKELRGVFKFHIVHSGSNAYIVDIIPQYGDEISGFTQRKYAVPNFIGEYENNRDMRIKDIKLNPTCYIRDNGEIDIECVYDYKTDRNSYMLEIDGKKIELPENAETFKLLDSYDAKTLLSSALANYENFSINDKRVLIDGSDGGKFFENAIYEIFKKGSFNAIAPDGSYRIDEIKASVKSTRIAKELLIKYLLQHAQMKYCGYSEIASLISEFYGLFESCPNIAYSTQTIYADLIEKAANSDSKTAYLRLRAYEDLTPDAIQKNYEIMLPKDFSNSEMSIEDLVEQMIGKDVKSVTMLTKYAYKNVGISRAISLYANVLKRKYNVCLKLITTRENAEYAQSQVAKEYYSELRNNSNIILIEKPLKAIEKIHDRYYKIERETGDVDWIKMTGELDALRYPNDFADGMTPNKNIDEHTKGRVKEMTILGVDRKGINPDVARAMEG